MIKDAGVNEFPGQGGGFLGKPFDPFRIESDRGVFRLPDIVLPGDVSADRLRDRRLLLDQLARRARWWNGKLAGRDRLVPAAGLCPDGLRGSAAGLRIGPGVGPVGPAVTEPIFSAWVACWPGGCWKPASR